MRGGSSILPLELLRGPEMIPVAVVLPRAMTGAIIVALILRIVVEIRRISEDVAIDSGTYLLIGLESFVALLAIFAVSLWLYSRPAYRLLGSVEAEQDELLLPAVFLGTSGSALAQLGGLPRPIEPGTFVVAGVSTRGIRFWAGGEQPQVLAQVPAEKILEIEVGRENDHWVEIGVLEIHVLDSDGQPVVLPCVIHTERLGAFWSLTRRELAGVAMALVDVWRLDREEETGPR